LAGKTDDQFVLLIIHELAHFVGPKHAGSIDDYAYGWIDQGAMKRLRAPFRLRNAENYGTFAFDVRYHRPPVTMEIPPMVI
jgi:hypothetical protein